MENQQPFNSTVSSTYDNGWYIAQINYEAFEIESIYLLVNPAIDNPPLIKNRKLASLDNQDKK